MGLGVSRTSVVLSCRWATAWAKRAMQELGVEHEKDHGFFVIPELGVGHPQTCLMDGMQIATGATYGKSLMEKTFWGKLAAVFYHPEKGSCPVSAEG